MDNYIMGCKRPIIKRLQAQSSILIFFMLTVALCCSESGDPDEKRADEADGYFSVAMKDGVWWFQSPEDRKFVSLGINHIEPVLITSKNNRKKFEEKYGDDLTDFFGRPDPYGKAAHRWLMDSIRLIRSWGFNTLGVHNPIPQHRMPYVAKFRPVSIDGWAGHRRTWVDPFDPDVEKEIDLKAAEWCSENGDDGNILGISFNDMTIWRSVSGVIHPWVRFVMGLDAQAPGKRKWLDTLKRNYPAASDAAGAYGINVASWEEMLENTEWPEPVSVSSVLRDEEDFLPVIADRWYGLISSAVRKYDKSHLVFGDKLEGSRDLPLWLDEIAGRYFDVIYIQWYAYAHEQIPRLQRLYEVSHKPVLMGDSSFSCPDKNLPRPKGVHVKSREQVGMAYHDYLRRIMNEPYVTGWHHCGFIEGSPDLKKYHPYYAVQSGFLRPDGRPYKNTISWVKKANSRAGAWHRAAGQDAGRISDSGMEQAGTGEGPGYITEARKNCVLWQVDDNVYAAAGFRTGKKAVPVKNISWVVTDEGVVVIDAGFPRTAAVALKAIRSTTAEQIKYLIYTHHHETQTAGALNLAGSQTRIIAHENLVQEFDMKKTFLEFNRRRDSIQFNIHAYPVLAPLRYPDITYRDTYTFGLGGVRFDLYHVVGEADDYTVVHMPEQGIVWTGDLLGASAPMVASPMKRVRDEVKWRRALEFIASLNPEVLIGAVGPPCCDKKVISSRIRANIDYLDFLHEAVAREMNRGASVEQAVENIRLPEKLARSPYLEERYACLEFNVRGLYHRYSGWFSRNGSDINPVSDAERAAGFIKDMGGESRVILRAKELIRAGKPALALEYIDLLILNDDGNSEVHELKAYVLGKMAKRKSRCPLVPRMYRKLAEMEQAKADSDSVINKAFNWYESFWFTMTQ